MATQTPPAAYRPVTASADFCQRRAPAPKKSARTRCPSLSSPETLPAHIILRGAFGQTNDRGDNFDETDVARPFRISHRGGRGQDPHRSVLSDNPSWHKGWIGSLAGEDSTRGDTGRRTMKAIVVTDQAAGTAGMTLVERPEP